MLTYSEYYNLCKLGLNALQEKVIEASNFTSEQYHRALQKEQEESMCTEPNESVEQESQDEEK